MKVLLPFVCVVLFVAFTTADTVGDSADEIENEESFLEKRRRCPTIIFPCSRGSTMPVVCKNMRDAIRSGHPKLLHRVSTADSRKNRRASRCPALTRKTKAKRKKAPGLKMSCDEYPFASSKQGGTGAKIMMVPANENSKQGGLLSAFYKRYSIGTGDCYRVVA